MFRTVLVPLDGSNWAEQAIPFAASIVRRTSGMLHLIRSHSSATLLSPESGFVVDVSLDDRLRETEGNYLKETAAKLRQTSPIAVTPVLLPSFASEAICAHASSAHADLIVMATHGRGGLSRLWLGSMADAMIRSLHVPILLIHPSEDKITSPVDFEPRRILVPLDGSELAEQILEPAISLGGLTQAELILVRVVGPCLSPLEEANEQLVAQYKKTIEEYLNRVADKLRERALAVKICAIVNKPVATSILEQAHIQKADVIAVATHGRGDLGRVLVGSVADKVIRGSEVPVLVCRCT